MLLNVVHIIIIYKNCALFHMRAACSCPASNFPMMKRIAITAISKERNIINESSTLTNTETKPNTPLPFLFKQKQLHFSSAYKTHEGDVEDVKRK